MDRAAIFTDVIRRNDLRRQHQLPLLNVRQEYDFQIALAGERERQEDLPELAQQFAIERALIETQVIADLRAQQGPEMRYSAVGCWTIVNETRHRFRAFLRETQNLDLPLDDDIGLVAMDLSGALQTWDGSLWVEVPVEPSIPMPARLTLVWSRP